VYILGAGFSADAGLPTIADFLNQMRDAADWLGQEKRQKELAAVDAVLDFRHNAAAAGYRVNVDLDNIEDLFSLAAALPQQTVSRDVQAAIAATLNYSQRRKLPPQARLRVSEARGWPITEAWRAAARRVVPAGGDSEDVESSVYDYYASVLAGRTSNTDNPNRNIVITFNYDLLLEEALDRLAIPFCYGLSSDSVTYDSTARSRREPTEGSLLILKLHGSLNWSLAEGLLTVFGSYDEAMAASGHPYLVPPTWEKAVGGPIRTVWEGALHALTQASRLIVVGFSFRPGDAHFKYLLAAGLMQNSSLRHIVVVNPVATRLASQIQSVLRADQFEYGVVRLQDKSFRNFVNSPQDLNSIARPLVHDGLDLFDLGTGYVERRLFLQP
jgi:hypothetical protein